MCFFPLCMAIPRVYVYPDYSVTFFSTDAHASPIRIIRGPMGGHYMSIMVSEDRGSVANISSGTQRT